MCNGPGVMEAMRVKQATAEQATEKWRMLHSAHTVHPLCIKA